ncbi:MAG: hypothetical protein J6Q69_02315 [Clostridia bacterium]|nr:hypothetical protein [Clostridia bacterium]
MTNFANINDVISIDRALRNSTSRLGDIVDFEAHKAYTVSDDGKSISVLILTAREDLFREDDAGCFVVSLEISDEHSAFLSVRLEDYLELTDEDVPDDDEGAHFSDPTTCDWLIMPELYYGGAATAHCKLTFSSVDELCRLICERMRAFDDAEFISEFAVKRYNHYFDEE